MFFHICSEIIYQALHVNLYQSCWEWPLYLLKHLRMQHSHHADLASLIHHRRLQSWKEEPIYPSLSHTFSLRQVITIRFFVLHSQFQHHLIQQAVQYLQAARVVVAVDCAQSSSIYCPDLSFSLPESIFRRLLALHDYIIQFE